MSHGGERERVAKEVKEEDNTGTNNRTRRCSTHLIPLSEKMMDGQESSSRGWKWSGGWNGIERREKREGRMEWNSQGPQLSKEERREAVECPACFGAFAR
jgi:hypothetical protein